MTLGGYRGAIQRTEVPENFADRIRRLRAKLGLTQMRLAELMGVSFASVNRWENGQRPSPLAWRQITRAEDRGIDALGRPRDGDTVEPAAKAPPQPEAPPNIDFSSDPEIVRVVAEGERLTYGHLFNPAFAAETSLIDPLPHQRIAVYENMLPQMRLRFLLADDAGAGKTIMAGLYIREMLSRRLIRRVLIVPPAGLIGNWERELQKLFNLNFDIVMGAEARTGNPFTGTRSNHLIVSIDTLAGDRMFARLQEAAVAPYDLVIFDEAHKLSRQVDPDGTVRATDRYRLAEALAGIPSGDPRWTLNWRAHHLLLLTATPHMGKDYPYFSLWRLLEPEVLTTLDAFAAYPPDARARHFIRRAKEEMVRFDGSPIYPPRICDTHSYDLTPGAVSEQTLYDRTTEYIQFYYNQSRILNRSAVRLAMSIFQRRLASSTYALMRSFERRKDKLQKLIDDINTGRLRPEDFKGSQRKLDVTPDVQDERTGDEEQAQNGNEENEVVQDHALGAFAAVDVAGLIVERDKVAALRELAREVYEKGEESKFQKLLELIRSPRFKDEKILIFTEHRDTMGFLVRKLEGLGYTGQVAQIHGGMDFREREEQVEFFRRPNSEDGAAFMVATDAAGEGINLQFCWLMVNYDIPWNPARLEQRMGRIHRYNQKHDRVVIMNVVAGKTREGRVIKTLLEKLERIRKELRSDKVFDVIGRLFEGVSLKDYMIRAVTDEGTEQSCLELEGKLTQEQVEALEERERRLYGEGGDVKRRLGDQKLKLENEDLRRLLPGYVQRFIEKAAPLVGLDIEGSLDRFFSLRATKAGALDPLWPVLESYPPLKRRQLTVYKPPDPEEAVFLHPGEPLFDRLRGAVCGRFARPALKGGVFVDPNAKRPYLYHLALVSVARRPDPNLRALAEKEILEFRLVGLKQEELGLIEPCPVEYLLLLKGGRGIPAEAIRMAEKSAEFSDRAKTFAVERVARPIAEARRNDLLRTKESREDFISRGFDYQDADLAAARAKMAEKACGGDPKAKVELTKIKERQRLLARNKEEALETVRREPDLIVADDVVFLAHALVVPSSDPEDRKRHDAEVEAIAMRVALGHEGARGVSAKDVSKPDLARAAGLTDYPGFDILSRKGPDERGIEVKGRAATGDVELTENEWSRAINLRERYWLYVVFDCASPQPRLVRVQDPFKLFAKARGGVIIDDRDILAVAETD